MSTEASASADTPADDDVKFLAPKLLKKKPKPPSNSSTSGSNIPTITITAPSDNSAAENPLSTLINSLASAQQTASESTDGYIPPSWAEIPPESSNHVVEVMSNGVIKGTFRLQQLAAKSFVTVGRAETCDIKTTIPGSSRLHCYLQYGEAFDGRGWYVFDKSSTHGTFVNKQELPKSVYYKAKPGSVIQITKGNFHLFLTGDDESSQNKPKLEEKRQPVQEEAQPSSEPAAKPKENFLEKDPVAQLRSFCEKEGVELTFTKVSAKGKEHTYAFDLPDDVADGNGGSFKGTGPDALAAQKSCAIEVLEHLNNYGLLDSESRQSSRQKLEDNEFYESDEDDFFDRTGQIETQRKKRIQRHNASLGIKEESMTYDQLVKKVKQLDESRKVIEEQLERLLKPTPGAKISPDEIDVSSLKSSISVRLEVSKLKRKYEENKKESKLMERAREMAKPTKIVMAAAPKIEKKNEEQHEKPKEIAPSATEESKPTIPAVQIPNESSEQLPKPNDSARPTEDSPSTSSQSPPPKASPQPTPKPKAPQPPPEPKKFGLITPGEYRASKQQPKKRTLIEVEEEELLEDKRNKIEELDEKEAVDWVPPVGQTGDGRTKLNEKFAGRY